MSRKIKFGVSFLFMNFNKDKYNFASKIIIQFLASKHKNTHILGQYRGILTF